MNLSSVSQQLLYSTLRLEADKAHGTEAGTGFIFALHHDGQDYLFVVTNKHVVEGARTGRMFFTRAQEGQPRPRIGERYDLTISDFSRAWTGHPDSQIDVAAMPLVPLLQHINDQGVAVFFKSIPSSMVPTDTVLQELDALEEVVFVGYPNGIYDRRNLLPIMRRGTTATPVYVDYEGAPTFLIDASVFPGSSGSPVLIVNEGSYRAQGGMVIGSRVLFLGIIASVAIRHERGTIELMDIPNGTCSRRNDAADDRFGGRIQVLSCYRDMHDDTREHGGARKRRLTTRWNRRGKVSLPLQREEQGKRHFATRLIRSVRRHIRRGSNVEVW